MFTKKTHDDTLELQDLIDAALMELSGYNADTPEYDAILKQIERLHALKDPNQSRKPVSYDTLLLVGANLAGIGLILSYEHFAPVASKALGFVTKLRL